MRGRTQVIIVTGGAGFIGSAITWVLNKRGQNDIIIVDEAILSYEKKQNLAALKYKDYISKEEFIKKIRRKDNISAIIHMGACSDTTQKDEKFLLENNYEY